MDILFIGIIIGLLLGFVLGMINTRIIINQLRNELMQAIHENDDDPANWWKRRPKDEN